MDEGLVILGAGVSGLSVAYHARGGAAIYEAAEQLGGLCRTLRAGGYLLDLGVHTLFTSDPYVSNLYEQLLEGRLNSQESLARIYYCGTYVDFPFQANLWQVPESDRVLFLESLKRERNAPREIRTYKDWLIASFGPAMAQAFMIPYNEKKYGVDLARLDASEFQLKNPVPSAEEMEAGSKAPPGKTYGHNPRWRYPKDGGFQSLVDALAARVEKKARIHLSAKALKIDPSERLVFFQGGKIVRYDLLVSTIPLDSLLRMTPRLPEGMRRNRKLLQKRGVRIMSFGVRGEPQAAFHWAYFPQREIPFLRVSIPSFFAADVAPEGHHLIQAEVTQPQADLAAVEEKLQDVGILSSLEGVVFRHVANLAYAYPLPTIGLESKRRAVLEELESLGIYSIGRFGSWRYQDADKCLMEGRDLAWRLGV